MSELLRKCLRWLSRWSGEHGYFRLSLAVTRTVHRCWPTTPWGGKPRMWFPACDHLVYFYPLWEKETER